jgi:hypothetical protein
VSDKEKSGPRVVEFTPQATPFAKARDEIARNLSTMIETVNNVAKFRRAAFLAYVENGFSEAQALELCCK